MALRDALEVTVYRGTELELLPPDLIFIMLNTDEVLRDAPLDNYPAHPYAGRASPEIALGSSRHPVPGASLAERRSRRDHTGGLGPVSDRHLRLFRYRLCRLHHRLRQHHC